MASEWPVVRLGDVAAVRSGFAFKSSDWTNGGVPVVKIANVKDGRLVMDGCSFVRPEGAATAAEFDLMVDDVLIAMTGYIGDVALVRPSDLPAVLNQRVGRFSIRDKRRLEHRFLFYLLRSPKIRSEIQGLGFGSAQPNVSPSLIHDVEVPLPPLHAQRAIAHILGTLDDKIELNRRMKATLEAIARALFKSWFVDFDPVRAKSEGRDPGLPPHLADLFPDSFADSELGEIPAAWGTASLGDAAIFPLVSPGVQWPDRAQVTYIATGDVHGNVVTGETAGLIGELPSRANMQPGEGRIWFAKMKDSPKHLWTMSEDESWWARRILSTGFAGIHARHRQLEALLYGFISSLAFDEAKNGLATGTTMQAMNNQTLGRIRVVVPDPPVAALFDRVVRPIYRQVWENEFESRALANIRDALLPRLVAGKLRVTDADQIVAIA